jgi:hypothetical protein
MGKFLPLILTAAGGVVSTFMPTMQAAVSRNPAIAMGLATLAAIMTALTQSPVQPVKDESKPAGN